MYKYVREGRGKLQGNIGKGKLVDIVVKPDLPGSEIICLSGSKLIVKIIMCPSLELTFLYKLIIPLLKILSSKF
jgi:hypothetical protein